MKLTFVGTGAADWVLGKNEDGFFRRYSSLLIDDCLLIDPNAQVIEALNAFNKNPNKIQYIINTHTHEDHFNKATISALRNAKFIKIRVGQVKRVGNYTITALKGNHATSKNTVHFVVDNGKKKLFYGLDGAWLTYEEFIFIKNTCIDYAVLDCTIGNALGDYRIFEHNNIAMVKEIKSTLNPYVKRFCISHMAKTLHGSHEQLSKELLPYNIEVAFDGYETEI